MKRSHSPLRRLTFDALESRRLLAAQISELLVDPLFGDKDEVQMVELRGAPQQTLSQGTYLVIASERTTDFGKIHGIFDLSGLSFGSNGYLVLLEQNSPHQVDGAANVLVSTEPGFGGLPGDIYSDSHSLSDRIDFIIGANGYFLVESSTPPVLGESIDATADGVIDPVQSGVWNVLDSISLHPFVGRGERALGDVVFAEIGSTDPNIQTRDGVSLVATEGFGYAARVGESTGSTPADWIASTVVDESEPTDTEPRWAVADNLFGVPSQYAFSGRDLDHVGGPNFVGGVRGIVTNRDSGQPIEGATLFADTNQNGLRDNLTFVVEPDAAVPEVIPVDNFGNETEDYPLINAYPGVTITNYSLDSFPSSAVTSEREADFPNKLVNRIFATGGIAWFSNSGVLRFDFYDPVNAVTIEAIGSDNSLSPVYGRIEAYNAAGELLATDLSSRLIDSQREMIGVSTGQDNIAYVYAYSDEDEGDGGPFGRFDHLTYSQYELAAQTDSDGYYELTNLFPGTYEIQPLGTSLRGPAFTHQVTRYEHAVADFELGPNRAPEIQAATFALPENSTAQTVVGQITATDPDGDPISFSFQEPNSDFLIDASTGEITVAENASLNFESSATRTPTVVVADGDGLSVSRQITITLSDVNDAPVLDSATINVAENSNGQLHQLQVSDDDASQGHTFLLVGGTAESLVEITDSGQVMLRDGAELDFESGSEYTLVVRVTDDGQPALFDEQTITLAISDVNEPPVLVSNAFTIDENAVGSLGQIAVEDPDANQFLSFTPIGGTGVDLIDVTATGELMLKDGQILDFESTPELTLLVRIADNGLPSESVEETITVTLVDVNEPPAVLAEIDPQSATTGSMFQFGLPPSFAEDPEGSAWTVQATIAGETLPNWLQFDPSSMTMEGIPTSFDFGTIEVTLRVYETGAPEIASEVTFPLTVDLSNTPLYNATTPQDVNGDRLISPIDALRVINYIARTANASVDSSVRLEAFYDVTGDNLVSPIDALRVINELARRAAEQGGSEGESTAANVTSDFLSGPGSAFESDDHDDALLRFLDEAV
ncbi:hypothetical protein FYK55_07630 [Roseiconus nitratireducens]|uniref:Cadherin domain-containing protein n=1 Tax=Roseiconus nitratireducens TaxID=2605748 RepID=A0A5M6DJN8_9BACT|nr:cadherin domain-containing protein [Roseiconus nitratireducens]KAA5545505.1 hypothetical protein FYK55_07630 [Roseiconus nitratireducens]